jgi:hypothetical protein
MPESGKDHDNHGHDEDGRQRRGGDHDHDHDRDDRHDDEPPGRVIRPRPSHGA